MQKHIKSSSSSRMSRSNSQKTEKLNDKNERTSSLQRKRSVISILPSSSTIQKPERGRSRNRSVTRFAAGSNDIIVDREDDNGDSADEQDDQEVE